MDGYTPEFDNIIEVNQTVSVYGTSVFVEGFVRDGEFYGNFYCNLMVRGDNDQLFPAHETYSISKTRFRNGVQKIKYTYHISRPKIAGGDETYTKTHATYNEMRTANYMVDSVLTRIHIY